MLTTDIALMANAVQLAAKGLYTTMPNPRVGCLITKNDQVIAEGWHQFAGGDHAEICALNNLSNSDDAIGATIYVTLEPCSHQGKTGPCCDALINAGIKRLVYGMQDPNPAVAGRGLQKLRDAGIEIVGPVLENECRLLNPGFIKRMQTGLPFVRIKLAMSLDGRTAMANGSSQWITGTDAREDVQKLRARSCAIITGSGTVIHDDPALTVRSEKLPEDAKQKQPLRVILNNNTEISKGAKIFASPGEVLQIDESRDLKKVLLLLAEKQCNEILVEAGATLAGAFVQQRLVDELVIYMAPCLMGSDAMPLLKLPIKNMNDQIQLAIQEIRTIGNDWRITAKTL